VEFIKTNITTQVREKEKDNFEEFIICKIIAELEANLSHSLLTIAQCQLETNSTLKFKQKNKMFYPCNIFKQPLIQVSLSLTHTHNHTQTNTLTNLHTNL
jgi:hypothetical protein